MVNKPRIKGTAAESALVAYLQLNGFEGAERRSLKGVFDLGDVTGCPGLVFESKVANSGLRMAKWMAETGIERINAGADHGILVIKPAGLGTQRVGRWYAVMDYLDHEHLRDQCGGIITVSEPLTYDAIAIPLRLRGFDDMLAGTGLLGAVTLVPPGCRDKPTRYYRVMTLENMVTALRKAGYGSPIPEEAGLQRHDERL